MTKALTKGSPMRLIVGFGIPVLLGYLFQQFYSIVDTAIVGKTLGGMALAAVGSTGSFNFLVVGFSVGICGGFAIPVAQQFGAGNYQEMRRYITNAVWLCVAVGLAVTAATTLLCGTILTWMNTPADIYSQAYIYIITIFAGLPAYFLYNFAAGVLRSLGDSKTPVIWLIAASLVNIVLDIIFIMIFHLDVFGAALATVLAQLLAGTGCLIRMMTAYPILHMEQEDWHLENTRLKELCAASLPMGLQYSITAIGGMMIQAAVNGLGTAYVTAVTAACKVSVFCACPYEAMGTTMATYGGQNAGAKEWDRLHQGMRDCTLLGAVYSVAALVLLYFFAEPLNMLFLDNQSAVVLPLARRYLLTSALFFFPLSLVNIVRFIIQGMGFSSLAMLAGLFEMAARGGISLLVPVFGFPAACFASPAAWVLADLFLLPTYFYCCRKLKLSGKSTR